MEPLIQHKYIRFIAKKEGEREMTKKEKEIFRRYLDYSCTEMVRCMSDSGEGRTESAVASAVLRLIRSKGPNPFPFNAAPLIGGRFLARETQRKGYYVQAVVVGALETVIVGFRQKYCPPRLM